jgi:hypothetical protein
MSFNLIIFLTFVYMSIFLDQYSYLHFSTGIIAYFWGVDFYIWVIIHILYELLENLYSSIHIINKYITLWPGGKTCPDPILNRIGDVLSSAIGWLSAYYLDSIGSHYGWYVMHIQ